MTLSMYAASVPVFKQILGALDAVLGKAAVYATEKKIDPAVLLQSRLYPDMLPLVRQVQIASDFAKGISGRLAGVDLPAHEDSEQTLDELRARIAKVLALIDSLNADQFAGSEQREIVLRPGTPKERKFAGQAYLLSYGLPNFFFHVTTAYALLRHNGLSIGKADFMGAY
jgi:hypothetical protein